MSELSGPLVNIQFRKIDEEKPLDLHDAKTIENTTLSASRQDLYNLLGDGYEVWISNASGEAFTGRTEKHVIDNEAQNVLEDGYPLIIRRLHNSLVFKVNSNVEPFGLEAYAFFRAHVSKGELIESFGVGAIKAFDATLRKKK